MSVQETVMNTNNNQQKRTNKAILEMFQIEIPTMKKEHTLKTNIFL